MIRVVRVLTIMIVEISSFVVFVTFMMRCQRMTVNIVVYALSAFNTITICFVKSNDLFK